jgi:rubredoxin
MNDYDGRRVSLGFEDEDIPTGLSCPNCGVKLTKADFRDGYCDLCGWSLTGGSPRKGGTPI